MTTPIQVGRHPVPKRYHGLFHIGETDRRGNIIDFKVPPVIVDAPQSLIEYKQAILSGHVDAEKLPLEHTAPQRFLILRPTALPYRSFVREQLTESGLSIQDEFLLTNFMQLADILYQLDPQTPFHWQWRVIMRTLHEGGVQNQNTAVAFTFKDSADPNAQHAAIMQLKADLRRDMGEIPVIVRHGSQPTIALGIHHLHAPEVDRVAVEYNALMHARRRTSVFS